MILLCCAAAIWLASAFALASPIDDLRFSSPKLAKLVDEYAGYQQAFMQYATQQAFVKPYEKFAVAVHETIHLASAVHQGFYIEGVYYEPYLAADAWPAIRNSDVMPTMLPAEQGVIYRNYVRVTPKNNLGNILDEVNAYTHVLPFVCRYEPESAPRQATNLLGHLQVVEAYLRMARTTRPIEFLALSKNRLSAGAMRTLLNRAWASLRECGLPSDQIPKQEASNFLRLSS